MTADGGRKDDMVKAIAFALRHIERIGMGGLCMRKSWDVGEPVETRYELEKVEVLDGADVN